ncbi:MAG TPA: hypothetical protein VF041_17425 [Gemmatimonadaceae bacterium]
MRHVDGVHTLLRQATSLEMGVVVYAATGRESATVLAQLESVHRRFPHLPLLVAPATGVSLDLARRLSSAIAATVTSPLHLHDPAPVLDALVREGVARSAAGRLLALLEQARPGADPLVRRFVAHSATVPREVSSVGAVAERLGFSVRTLEKHLQRDGLPAARALFWSIMVVRGAVLLQDPRSTLQRIVALLPFPDSAAVSARFQRYAGARPSHVRHASAVDQLLTRLQVRLMRGQPGPGEPRP